MSPAVPGGGGSDKFPKSVTYYLTGPYKIFNLENNLFFTYAYLCPLTTFSKALCDNIFLQLMALGKIGVLFFY